MVWNDGGCKSYYLVNEDGKNTSIWPGSTATFRKQTKQIDIKNYEIITPKIIEEKTIKEEYLP